MAAIEFSRWFLALFFPFVAAFYTTAIIVRKRRLGRSPVIKGERGSLHLLIHFTFSLFRAAILVVCVARLPYPQIDEWLLPFRPLWLAEVVLAGNGLIAASFTAIVALHSSMGRSWRSGIEANGPAELLTSGAFAYCRNPMFLFIQLAQLGLFLSLPTGFTLLCLIVGVAAIQTQVRLEERHLEARHGDLYRRYKAEVPRWLPRWHGGRRP
jgi:protein-S-isoprenylcysteine O-methyltransferase Ste14